MLILYDIELGSVIAMSIYMYYDFVSGSCKSESWVQITFLQFKCDIYNSGLAFTSTELSINKNDQTISRVEKL